MQFLFTVGFGMNTVDTNCSFLLFKTPSPIPGAFVVLIFRPKIEYNSIKSNDPSTCYSNIVRVRKQANSEKKNLSEKLSCDVNNNVTISI